MTPTEWAAPSHPRGAVNRAGQLLAQNGVAADPLVIGHALDVVNDWRSSHSFPLNTFQMTLRKRSASICSQPIVAQRLKRTPSISARRRGFAVLAAARVPELLRRHADVRSGNDPPAGVTVRGHGARGGVRADGRFS